MPPAKPFCAGCVYQAPTKPGQPLIVFLHGDGVKKPEHLLNQIWPLQRVAKARGYGFFAPMCPKDQGCDKTSWWQWVANDPPTWLANQVVAIGDDYPYDPGRVWAVGWSGGASFLGYHGLEASKVFDAVVYVGGGIPPSFEICPRCSYPAYFISGDQNPYHSLAKDLRDYHQECGPEPVWNLIAGGNHAKEFTAYTDPGRAEAIVDWFESLPARTCASASAPSASASASSEPSATPDDAAPASPETGPVTHVSSAPPSHQSLPCGCDSSLAVAVFVAAVVARRWARKRTTTRQARNLLQNAG